MYGCVTVFPIPPARGSASFKGSSGGGFCPFLFGLFGLVLKLQVCVFGWGQRQPQERRQREQRRPLLNHCPLAFSRPPSPGPPLPPRRIKVLVRPRARRPCWSCEFGSYSIVSGRLVSSADVFVGGLGFGVHCAS